MVLFSAAIWRWQTRSKTEATQISTGRTACGDLSRAACGHVKASLKGQGSKSSLSVWGFIWAIAREHTMAVNKPVQDSWRAQTLAVRGGTRRGEFGETGEAIFATSGYVYGMRAG